ncbi:hypothetical protein AB1Y20_000488 [Prymnesium parvum]|uniref:Protein-tyrosine sulfotransferase n=1 Tax=Prymnesium parvum TaxID=97485 RepID=A0AB34K8K1_PRYPA
MLVAVLALSPRSASSPLHANAEFRAPQSWGALQETSSSGTLAAGSLPPPAPTLHPSSSPPHPPHPAASNVNQHWCPEACPVSPQLFVKPASDVADTIVNGVLPMSNATGISTTPPKCNLCEQPFLFIVSIGGRTGSTTILTQINAVPHIRLAGENRQMSYLTSLYEQASQHVSVQGVDTYCNSLGENASCGAWQRGPISPVDVLCDLSSYIQDIAVPELPLLPAPLINVRGFKDIIWTNRSLAMIRTMFPCSRLIYSVRTDEWTEASLHEAIHSYQKDLHLDHAQAVEYAASQKILQQHVKAQHDLDVSAGYAWKSFWQPLDTLNVTSINSMLTWLGVTGCSFDSLVHANANGYSNSGATIFDAMTHLIGNCTWPF